MKVSGKLQKVQNFDISNTVNSNSTQFLNTTRVQNNNYKQNKGSDFRKTENNIKNFGIKNLKCQISKGPSESIFTKNTEIRQYNSVKLSPRDNHRVLDDFKYQFQNISPKNSQINTERVFMQNIHEKP